MTLEQPRHTHEQYMHMIRVDKTKLVNLFEGGLFWASDDMGFIASHSRIVVLLNVTIYSFHAWPGKNYESLFQHPRVSGSTIVLFPSTSNLFLLKCINGYLRKPTGPVIVYHPKGQ